MELKSGSVDASHVAEQLQAGAEFAAKVVSTASDPTFRPILFHGQGLHPKQRKDINRAKVRIQGVEVSIKTARCGRPRNLAQALSPQAAA